MTVASVPIWTPLPYRSGRGLEALVGAHAVRVLSIRLRPQAQAGT